MDSFGILRRSFATIERHMQSVDNFDVKPTTFEIASIFDKRTYLFSFHLKITDVKHKYLKLSCVCVQAWPLSKTEPNQIQRSHFLLSCCSFSFALRIAIEFYLLFIRAFSVAIRIRHKTNLSVSKSATVKTITRTTILWQ